MEKKRLTAISSLEIILTKSLHLRDTYNIKLLFLTSPITELFLKKKYYF